MFDNGKFDTYWKQHKESLAQEIRNMIDLALDTNDEQWFKELRNRLELYI